MTKAELEAWRKRWELVEEVQRHELQTMPLAEKLRQFERLREWARQLGWEKSLREGDDELLHRWNRLRVAHHGPARA